MSTLAENVAKVTAAHAALKEAIAAKGVTLPEGTKLSGMPALVEQIVTPPDMTESSQFYEQSYKASIDVPAVVFVDFTATTNLFRCFSGCTNLTSLKLSDGFGQNATNLNGCFLRCSSLASLSLPAGFGQNATSADSCFNQCSSLSSLSLPDGFGQAATNLSYCFYSCRSLTTITGNPNFKVSCDLSPCANLTHDSLMVVVNGLQTVTTTKKLTLGSTNLAKLTDEEKKVATDKGWTLA